MFNYILNNLNWMIPSLITLIVGIITIFFSKKIKDRFKTKTIRFKSINLKKSDGNTIKIINNQFDNNAESNYTDQQKIMANHRLFELTDGLIKLATEAFRPIKFGDPKSFADYLNEIIDDYNEYIVFIDSKEILFNDDVIKIVQTIREIISTSIRHQKTIENFKSLKMPWEKIMPEIEALHKIYYNQIEKELPIYRDRLKEFIIKNNLP